MRKLLTKIYNAVKVYFRKLTELQREAIQFQSDMEKELWKDKK